MTNDQLDQLLGLLDTLERTAPSSTIKRLARGLYQKVSRMRHAVII